MRPPSIATMLAACEAVDRPVSVDTVKAWRATAPTRHNPMPAWVIEATVLYLGGSEEEQDELRAAMVRKYTPEAAPLRSA